MNDNDSERNSSGTPASLSPPASPNGSSIASGDLDAKSLPSRPANSYCTDPACTECWNNSTAYMMNNKLDRLRAMFPMLTIRTLESTLSRFRGNLNLASQHLLMSLRTSGGDYEPNVRRSPCRDPNCKECDTFYYNKSSPKIEEYPPITRTTNPTSYIMTSRKRPLDVISKYEDVPAKKLPTSKSFEYSRKSPAEEIRRPRSVEEIIRRRSPVEELIRRRSPVELYPSSADESDATPTKIKSRILLPPTLLKRCVDCKASISVDDKFCGQCGFKQIPRE